MARSPFFVSSLRALGCCVHAELCGSSQLHKILQETKLARLPRPLVAFVWCGTVYASAERVWSVECRV